MGAKWKLSFSCFFGRFSLNVNFTDFLQFLLTRTVSRSCIIKEVAVFFPLQWGISAKVPLKEVLLPLSEQAEARGSFTQQVHWLVAMQIFERHQCQF